jgi:hypothetical protein
MGCLQLNITKYIFYFEGVSSSVQRPQAGRYKSGASRKSIVGTPASVHGSKAVGVACRYEMVLIYQPPNAHVRISWILLRNAMAAAAVKKIYCDDLTRRTR